MLAVARRAACSSSSPLALLAPALGSAAARTLLPHARGLQLSPAAAVGVSSTAALGGSPPRPGFICAGIGSLSASGSAARAGQGADDELGDLRPGALCCC